MEHVGVGRRERGGRDLRELLVIDRDPRVRETRVGRRDGADQEADGAELRSARGPRRADRDGLAVSGAVARAARPLPREDDLSLRALAERVDSVERLRLDDVGLDAALRRRHAAAERGEHQPLGRRREHLSLFLAPLPVRDRDGLGAHVLKAERLHGGEAPGHGLGVSGRAGQPRADSVRQRAEGVERARRRGPARDQVLERGARLRGDRGRRRRLRGQGEDRRGAERRAEHGRSRPHAFFSGARSRSANASSRSLFSRTAAAGSASSLR